MEEDSKRKKGAKSIKDSSDGTNDKGASVTKMSVDTANLSETPKSEGTSKKVQFSAHEEVFPSSDAIIEHVMEGFKIGERFSLEEDEMIKAAVLDYIDEHGLGEDGLDKVLHAKLHPEVRHCWKEIALALPWRSSNSISYRGHAIFRRAEERGYTPEEYEIIRRFHEQMNNV